MAVFHADANLWDGSGTFRPVGTEFDVPVDGSNVPTLADDRNNLAANRMHLVTGGPGPTPDETYRGVDLAVNAGKIVRSDTLEEVIDPNSVVTKADVGAVVDSNGDATGAGFIRFTLTSDLSDIDDISVTSNPALAGVFDSSGVRVTTKQVKFKLAADGSLDDLMVVNA